MCNFERLFVEMNVKTKKSDAVKTTATASWIKDAPDYLRYTDFCIEGIPLIVALIFFWGEL